MIRPSILTLALALAAGLPAGALAAPLDPLTACLGADSYPSKADRPRIVADCDRALSLPATDARQRTRALVVRSTAQWRLDRNPEAEADAEAALKLTPNDPDALLARGAARAHLDRPDEALADYESALKVSPGNPIALLYRGRVRTRSKGDDAGALADFTAAIAADPKLSRAYAERAYLRLTTDPVAAERDLKIAIQLNPGEAALQRSLGVAYEYQDRPRDALATYDQILRADPKDAFTLNYRSTVKRALGDKAGALRDAERAVTLAPTDPDVYLGRAAVLEALEKPAPALLDYQQAAKLAPKDASTLAKLGGALRRAQRLDEALSTLEAAAKLAPDNSDVLFQRALVWDAKDQDDRAIKDYDALIALKPSSVAYYNRGHLIAATDDHKAALADFIKAAELDPKDADAELYKGVELDHLDRDDEALKAYDRALALNPAEPAPLINRGAIAAGRQDWAAAAVAYRAALKLAPDRADVEVALGEVLAQLDQPAEARRA